MQESASAGKIDVAFHPFHSCACTSAPPLNESLPWRALTSCSIPRARRCDAMLNLPMMVEYKCSTIAAGTYTFLVNAMVFLLYDSTPLAHGEINRDWYLGRRTIFRDFEFYVLDCMCMCSRRSFNSSPICMDREDDPHMRASRKS